jgi:hypothetical protein
MTYTFNLSKTNDIAAIVAAGFAGSIAFLSGVSVKASILLAVVTAAGVIGYTGTGSA